MKVVKKSVFLRVIEVFFFAVIIVAFIVFNSKISSDRRASFSPVSDSNNYAYQVESISADNDEIVVKGWFFKLQSVRNKTVETNNMERPDILFYDISSEEEKNVDESSKTLKGITATSVEWYDRSDVNDYFKCEYNYTSCGFIAKLKKSEIDLENGKYQIIFKTRNDNSDMSGIKTSVYIDRGLLCYINPNDKKTFEVQGTDLDEIVNDGVCLVSCPEHHIWVIQHEWKLYWIADEEFNFEEDRSTFIQLQIDTTQFDRLPRERIENGWYWCNIGDNFENYEVTDLMNCGRYRVSVRDIPTDYSVTRMVTGYYANGEWSWQRYFRPVYNFS